MLSGTDKGLKADKLTHDGTDKGLGGNKLTLDDTDKGLREEDSRWMVEGLFTKD